MTTESPKSQVKRVKMLDTSSIDDIALGTALSWVGTMVILSWWANNSSMLIRFVRAIWGAVFVYGAVFILLYGTILNLYLSYSKNLYARKKAKSDTDPTARSLQNAEEERMTTENVAH